MQELRNWEENRDVEEVCGAVCARRKVWPLPGFRAGAGDPHPTWEPGWDVG